MCSEVLTTACRSASLRLYIAAHQCAVKRSHRAKEPEMTTSTAAIELVVPPAGGERIWDGPISTVIKVPTALTGDGISIAEMDVPAGYIVPPHTHGSTDEWSYVLEGTIGARIGDEEVQAAAGSWILK